MLQVDFVHVCTSSWGKGLCLEESLKLSDEMLLNLGPTLVE